jgi:hypothetical protein
VHYRSAPLLPPNVENHLIAFNDELEELLVALMPNSTSNARSDPPPSNTPILCPKLRTLSFGSLTSGYIWYNFDSLWFAPLVRLVTARHVAGAPISMVEFRACQGVEENDVREAFGMMGGRAGLVRDVIVVEPETLHRRVSGRTWVW